LAIDLHQRVAAVTGSSSGIGRAIALALADAGCDVVLHGFRSMAALEEVVAEVSAKGRRAVALQADFCQPDQLADFAQRAWDAYGVVHIWINNAGADVLTGEIRSQTFAQKLEMLWRTDVVPTLLLSRDVGRRMQAAARSDKTAAGEYTILNIGWDQADQGMGGDAGELFGTTKGAIMAATVSLAQSLAPEVRVNGLAPGWIRTAWGESASEAWQVRAIRESLMGRWGSPQDVAQVAVFLCSPQAEFIAGQIIRANGGFRFGPADD
jgi:3-oxoacyl-[acyl-carrier protein] reductase